MNKFELKIIRQRWINDDGLDDKEDLCSHGNVFVQIGNEILSSENDSFWCTSAAALHLMRTIKQDYKIGDFPSQLIPCCGHFLHPDETGNSIMIVGCPNGIDWNVTHHDGIVKLMTVNNTLVNLSICDYKATVLNFVNEIESFYGNPDLKILPDDQFDKDSFHLFWKNWRELKAAIDSPH